MAAPFSGALSLADLVSFLARPVLVRVVSPHGVQILYEGKAGRLRDLMEMDSAPKKEGREAVAEWRYVGSLKDRDIVWGRRVELSARDYFREFPQPGDEEEFVKKHKGETFCYLFLEASEEELEEE